MNWSWVNIFTDGFSQTISIINAAKSPLGWTYSPAPRKGGNGDVWRFRVFLVTSPICSVV
jgi:hypothetical protein